MKTIWKFPLHVTDEQVIRMPGGSKILSVQTQQDQPVLWAMCDPQKECTDVKFVTYGTGHEIIEHPGNYIGTYQVNDGNFVFHVFTSD